METRQNILDNDTFQKNYFTFDAKVSHVDSPTHWAYLPSFSGISKAINSYLPSWESIKYYLPSYKNFLRIFISMISTIPLITYAFSFPTGVAPQDFTLDWYLELSLYYQIASILNALLFLGLDTIVKYDHLPIMLSKLIDIIKNSCRSAGDAINIFLILFFSSTAAIAGAGLGYDSFTWYPPAAPASAAINAVATFAFRVEFMAAFHEKIKNLFSEDAKFQQTVIRILEEIKKEYQEDFDIIFLEEKINNETVEEFINELFNSVVMAEEQQISIFNKQTNSDRVKFKLGQCIDIVIGSFMGLGFGAFFSINGDQILKAICSPLLSNCLPYDLTQTHQMLIAIIIGLSSGVLGFMTGLNLRDIVIETWQHIKQYPKDILRLIGMLIACGISQSSIYAAADSMVKRENIFGLTEDTWGQLFKASNVALIGIFCYKPLFNVLIRKDDDHLSVKNIINWLKTHDLPHEALTGLQQHSFFQKNIPQQEREKENTLIKSLNLANV